MKVLKNTTLSDIFITDTGVNLLASSSLTLNPTEYALWASSSDIITHIGSGDIVVNDGTEDLSKALGISLLQSNFRDTDFVDELKTSGRLRVSVYHENGGGSSTDEKVKISATDTTTDYLENKIEGVAGRIAISKLNSGVDESLQIDVGNQILDKSTDTTDDLSEGISNLYFTDNRAKDAAANSVTSATHDGVSTSYNSTSKELSITNTDKGSTAMSTHLADLDPHTQYLKESDNLLSTQNLVRVKKNPGAGEFLTIQSAIASISGASALNPYVIKVGPGEFIENQLTVPAYVSVEGESIQTTVVKTATTTQHLFVLNTGCELSFMSLYGSMGANKAAIYVEDGGDFTQLHKLSIYDFDIGIHHISNLAETYLYCEYVDINGDYSYAVKAEASTFINRTQLENFYTYESTNTNAISVYGSGTALELQAFALKMYNSNTQKGFVINNGTNLRVNGAAILGAEIGIEAQNIGAACTIEIISVEMGNNVQDYVISHPGTSGSVFGTTELDKNVVDPAANIYGMALDPVNGGIIVNGPFYYSEGNFNNLTDISELIVNTPPMGLVYGGELSAGTGLNANIATGYGYSMSGDQPNEVIKRRDWTSSVVSVPASSAVYIYMNESGVFTYGSTYPDTEKSLLIGRVVTDATSIIYVEKTPINAHHATNYISKTMREALGPIYISGSQVSETGTRQLAVTAGNYHYAELEFNPTGGSPIQFDTLYRSSTAGVYTRTANQSTVSHTQYDNGSGTLASIPLLQYTKHLLLVVGGPSEKYILVYGQDTYASLSEARNAPLPILPSYIKDSFCRVASVIVYQASSSIIEFIDERPRVGFASSSTVGGVSNHSELSGLSNDDHTQYLRVDGTRAMSGNLDMGASSITNVGTVDGVDVSAHASRHLPNGADPLTTGTPSSIGTANNTGIANAFARQDHVHDHGNQTNGSHHAAATTSVNGFMSAADKTKIDGITSLTTGSVPFSNGSTLTQDNANLFFDDTNNRLGVGTNTPDSTLTVKGAGAGKVNLGGWSSDTSYGALSLNGGIADPNNYNMISSNVDQSLYVNRPTGKDIIVREGNDAAAATTTVFKSSGNVGIGDTAPAYKLTVDGVIHSKTGGYRFPDGSVQTTAATGGGGGSTYTVKLTTTTQATTSTTLSDITELTSPSLAVGLYRVQVTGLFQSASATNGAGFRLLAGTSTINLYVIDWEVQQGTNGTDQDYEYKQLDATTNVTSASVATANVNYRFNGWGIINVTSAGTVRVQFRSELAGTAITVQVNSALILEKLT